MAYETTRRAVGYCTYSTLALIIGRPRVEPEGAFCAPTRTIIIHEQHHQDQGPSDASV